MGEPRRLGHRRARRQDRRRAAAPGARHPLRGHGPRARRHGAAQPRRRGPLFAPRHLPPAGEPQASAAGRVRMSFYHAGMRELQERFDSRRLAERLDEKLGRAEFSAEDREFIESRELFFLATADAEGRPDCSYKGGDAGFVRMTDAAELAFPSYDGNGMFRSLGNLLANPAVALLFIDFERPRRLRANGLAGFSADATLMRDFVGAQLVLRVPTEL